MADRMIVIARLGVLIEDAVQRGDDRASETLRDALEILVADKATVEKEQRRRGSDRERKPAKNPRIPRKSTESAEILGGSQGFPPTPPLPNSPNRDEDDTGRAKGVVPAAEEDPMLEINRGLLSGRMGALFADAEAFVKRRNAVTWAAWFGEMLTCLTGGHATPEDVAQVCRDDAALARQVGSPRGFRIFVANAVRDRMEGPSRPPARGGERPSIGQRAFDTALAALGPDEEPR